MTLYHCLLTLHDNVFFASREMGILYETEKYLHNWALSFALFTPKIIPQVYRLHGTNAQTPSYLNRDFEANLLHLNQAKIYVFPAQPLHWSYQINTFKAAQTTYYGRSKQFGDKGAERNYPINYGRAKELAIGSQYRTYIIAPPEVEAKIPRWIRLGKWAAKVRVEFLAIPENTLQKNNGEYSCLHPLNPLDLPSNTQLILYNRIVMPPSSLVSQARIKGEYWQSVKESWTNFRQQYPQLPEELSLPIGAFYGANTV
ncbi:type I-D CRISPR-associated protein Cas5/Csc1 [Limnoraphis robusta Tam1]|uniref:type I-D CRISPR-associated protein Cas5/Csc1 n=1 Tax=Limnoraphis robusta TaxID=1118279 RepID=UPI002B1F44AD|nr:type I-D CRISPR-associated protein Cas5/Csc1 [Limnoraphis robusta]MEA5542469.1 type I-D CRISPR-associated protein Cas5/Csc1 [Limnoraphis robusta Tam1]